jgi:hypothetical protein
VLDDGDRLGVKRRPAERRKEKVLEPILGDHRTSVGRRRSHPSMTCSTSPSETLASKVLRAKAGRA